MHFSYKPGTSQAASFRLALNGPVQSARWSCNKWVKNNFLFDSLIEFSVELTEGRCESCWAASWGQFAQISSNVSAAV